MQRLWAPHAATRRARPPRVAGASPTAPLLLTPQRGAYRRRG
ncbi:hypothetical protein PJP10_07490 [Mycobacterium kansasii]